MKQGIKPTRQQRAEIATWGLNPENWLISKNEPRRLTLVHRATGRIRIIERREPP